MAHKCDNCDERATHHSVEIIKGQKIEKHLCDDHAKDDGMLQKAATHMPISELLTTFVKQQTGAESTLTLECTHCGLSFEQFREHSLLGCPACYDSFDEVLSPLLERHHEGATHHIGKVPRRAGVSEHRQQRILQMRKQLADAVADEDYEKAANLRDQIRVFEEGVA